MDDSETNVPGADPGVPGRKRRSPFAGQRREEVYAWTEQTLVRHRYPALNRMEKGLYVARMTGLSRAQVTRLIAATDRGTDGEIAPAFPDSPPEKSLLSPELLEEFVQRRPKTKDDWFKFPQPLRTAVESKQIAKYLEHILQIVAEGQTQD